MLNSVIRISRKYYPQTLLEECKHEMKKNKIENLINDDLDPSPSDDETKNDSDSEFDNKFDNESFSIESQNYECILITIILDWLLAISSQQKKFFII